MSRVHRCALVVIAASALAACASPTLVWHTLVKPAADGRGHTARAPTHSVRGVDHVFEFVMPGLPVQVDRAELVLTDGATRQVRVLEGDRWLAPLPEEVRAALARGYAGASGARDATGLPRPQGVPVLRIRTMLRRFEMGAQDVALDAEWSLQLVGDAARSAALCRTSITTRATDMATGGAGRADVRAMQDAIDAWAASMSTMAGAWIGNASTPCPAMRAAVAGRD